MGPILDCGRFCKLKKKNYSLIWKLYFIKRIYSLGVMLLNCFFFQNEYSINPQLIIQIISIIK
jgi:hypothetical protein